MEELTAAVTGVVGIAGQAVKFITDNPLCLAFLAASLLGIGFTIFKRAKRSAR